MQTQFGTDVQQGATWQQRVVDRLRSALRPLRWLLARANTTPLDDIDGAQVAADPRRSVVITMRSSDQIAASAQHTSRPERQPRALALIPVRIATAQPGPRGRRRHRHE